MARLPFLLGVVAGMACGITISLSRPASADASANAPVEATVRHDVHASCARFAEQMEDELQHFWTREQLFGDVEVQFVLDNGRIGAVQTQGRFSRLNSAVRAAVQRLSCGPQAAPGAQVYRFRISLIDPDRVSRGEAFARAAARAVPVAERQP